MRPRSLAVLALMSLPVIGEAQTRNASTRAPALPAGEWLIGIAARGDTSWMPWTLRVTGDSVHGDMGRRSPDALRGTFRRDTLDLVQYRDSVTVRARFRAAVKDGRFVGQVLGTKPGGAALVDTAVWIGRAPAARPGPPRTLSFEPSVFYRVFSGGIAPVMTIFPGDTVRTRTVDAGGVDWNGVARSAGGNPQTGPFYVEGAMPGDVVAIRLHTVRLNRDWAVAGTGLVGSAVTPSLAGDLPEAKEFSGRWTLDRARGVARLASPTPALARYEVPLRPMLGCIAVAPSRGQAIRTQDSGPFGGNMDYNQLREGTTVYLVVNVPGALIYVGDGHAAQGDGEVTGDALETSMDVEFSVEVDRTMRISTPRAESSEYLMSIGIAGDLQEALRQATSDLARWLSATYKLNAAEVASLLGTALRYDVADMVGTQMSIVAKVPKSAVAALGGGSGG